MLTEQAVLSLARRATELRQRENVYRPYGRRGAVALAATIAQIVEIADLEALTRVILEDWHGAESHPGGADLSRVRPEKVLRSQDHRKRLARSAAED
jgi:hypothetical protein